MLYILLSVICSVTVSVLLKLAKRYEINILQAITTNYIVAAAFSFLLYQPDLAQVGAQSPWWAFISLALLLPSVFLILGASVKQAGIVKTDIAQRLSLFISIVAAWLLFKETFNNYKIIGLILGFVAIFFVLRKPQQQTSERNQSLAPLFVFLGFGIIDILFKQVALSKEVPYTTSLTLIFILSFIVAVIISAVQVIAKKEQVRVKNILCGIILGFFNFGNILFYMKAHKLLHDNPSTVFAAMNLGVIIIGSLTGIIIFKERLNRYNYVGIILAIIAVICITLSQIYAAK
ncbi:EamA domain-containing membrane protein RarD [Chitinophaga sp. YR627]|uniref:DMT family transporter n=1 Tax=Chitinophaga sp. YR627 TaxID=1881041 RepID=UPI0008E8552D|nr:DMT family transporter [Chitinophaga sp. YR627]SFO21214.1 EamA domain-containing membrane protein RarD [Chitinophaga sp. YR627]